MKRPFILLAAVVIAALLLITALRWRSAEERGAAAVDEDAAKLRVRTFWAAYNHANELRSQGKFREAAIAYRQSLELNPQHEDSLYYLGTSHYELGEYSEAAATLRKMLELNPQSARAWSQLGNTLSVLAPGASADFEEARRAYQHNVEINREQSGPFLRLGLLDLNQGHRDAALANFRIAAGFGSPEAGYLLAYTLFLEKKDREAVIPLRKILDAYGRDKKITGQGVLSEGDVLPAPGKPLTALERAGLKSILLLYWISARSGGYLPGIPNEFHVQPPPEDGSSWIAQTPVAAEKNPALIEAGGRRLLTADLDGDGKVERVEINPDDQGSRSLRYLHEGGDGWQDRTAEAGLDVDGTAIDGVVADYDRDGKPDLLILYWKKGARLFHNLGNGRFSDVTAQSGLHGPECDSWSVRFLDYDRDGFPDVLMTAHAPYEDVVRCLLDPLFHSTRNTPSLFRNRGDGTFQDVTKQANLDRCYGTKQAAIADFDGDGWPDLLLANGSLDSGRLEPSVILRNEEGKKFSQWSYLPGFSIPSNVVAAAVVDANHDGRPDVYLAFNPKLQGSNLTGGLFVNAGKSRKPGRLVTRP